MKPEGRLVARRLDYTFDAGTHGEAVDLVRAFHYAKSASNTSTVRTIMRRVYDGARVGAALWMPPTAGAAKGLAARLLGDAGQHKRVLVLSRLVVAPGEPQNAAGMLLGHSTREVIAAKRWTLLVTYADEAQGHKGTIYRATGWTFDGFTNAENNWWIDGRQVSRFSTKSRSTAQMLALGATPLRSRKIRFVKLLDP